MNVIYVCNVAQPDLEEPLPLPSLDPWNAPKPSANFGNRSDNHVTHPSGHQLFSQPPADPTYGAGPDEEPLELPTLDFGKANGAHQN